MGARLNLLVITGLPAMLGSVAAQATELCVKCTGPDANYACVVGGPHPNATLDTVSRFYCITTIAKAGSHASCAIDRSVTAPCPGIRKELPIPAFLNGIGEPDQPEVTSSPAPHHGPVETQAANAPVPPAAAMDSAAPVSSNPPQATPANEPPPKTLQEMMEKSAKSAGDGINETQKSAGEAAKSASTALEKAGSAVGGAAKSSWKCLSSFFSKC